MVQEAFLSLPRMNPDRLEAYRAHFRAEFEVHTANQRLELSRFRSRRLTQGEWDALQHAFGGIAKASVDPRLVLAKRWGKILQGLTREHFRVFNEPPRGHSVIEYLAQGNGLYAFCRKLSMSDPESAFLGAMTVVHSIACREVVTEGLDLDRHAFDFMTCWHIELVRKYRMLKAAGSIRNTVLVYSGRDESREVAWGHAAHVTEPIMDALIESREARSDAFYAPSGALMGAQITPQMIEDLLPGIKPSL